MRLILDILRRWRWVYIGLILFLGFLTWFNMSLGRDDLIYPVAFLLGPFLLAFELSKGTARLVISLPMERKRLGQLYWTVGVGLPTIVIAILQVGTLVILRARGAEVAANGSWIAISVLWNFAYAGTAYWALTFIRIRPANDLNDLKDRISANLAAAFWGASIGGWLLVSKWLPSQWDQFGVWAMAGLAAGIACTAAGYFRSFTMIAIRAGHVPRQNHKTPQGLPQKTAQTSRGPTGTQALLLISFRNALQISLLMLLVLALFSWLRTPNQLEVLNKMAASAEFRGFTMYWFLCAMFILDTQTRWILSLRHLRSLPLSAGRLNGLLAASAAGSCLIILAIPIGLYVWMNDRWPDPSLIGWMMAFVGLCCWAKSLLIRRTEKSVYFGVRIGLLFAVSAVHLWISWGIESGFLGAWKASVAIGLFLFLHSLWLDSRALSSGSAPYKKRDLPFAWAGAGGN